MDGKDRSRSAGTPSHKSITFIKAIKKIRNDKCGICSKDVSQARMLNCLHSFCSSCLKMILLNGRITCPDCGETTMIDNVGDLPLDYTKLSHTSRSTRYLNHKTQRLGPNPFPDK